MFGGGTWRNRANKGYKHVTTRHEGRTGAGMLLHLEEEVAPHYKNAKKTEWKLLNQEGGYQKKIVFKSGSLPV